MPHEQEGKAVDLVTWIPLGRVEAKPMPNGGVAHMVQIGSVPGLLRNTRSVMKLAFATQQQIPSLKVFQRRGSIPVFGISEKRCTAPRPRD